MRPAVSPFQQKDGTSIVCNFSEATRVGEIVVVVPENAEVFSGFRDLKIGIVKSLKRDVAQVVFGPERLRVTRVDLRKHSLFRVLGRLTPIPL
jgi:hypothetical protein